LPAIIQKIKNKIDQAKDIAIICHIRPDGDTVGAGLALSNYIKSLGKKCVVYCDDVMPAKYAFLKGFEAISAGEASEKHDLVICVDCSDLKRTGNYENFVSKHKNTINIDHHISNENFALINYVEDISSTCEIIYKILKAFKAPPDRDTYICIYCGLSSDTGNFSHSNTTYKSFETAASLAKVIGNIDFINQKIYKEIPLCRLRLLAETLKSLQLFADGKIAVLTVYMSDLEKTNCEAYETEGFVDYAINIDGVDIGAILLESKNRTFKISLRSKKADVCKIAAEFGGGGHIHASGCMLFGERDEVVNKLVKTAEFYLR
jgi:phosphoesterase RecJ-like protein